MENFIPFIHKHEPKRKEEMEPLPLYIEMVPPPPQEKTQEEKEERGVIIIEL
jgi:hypothetical protein